MHADFMQGSARGGPWASDDLSETIKNSRYTGVDDTLPEATRFVANVAKVLKRHLARHPDEVGTAIFLLAPEPPEVGPDLERAPTLGTGIPEVFGRIWFVNAVAQGGHFVEAVTEDHDAMFVRIETDLRLGGAPAVLAVYDDAAREIRFYPAGLEDMNAVETTSLQQQVDLDAVLAAVDRAYTDRLITPGRHLSALRIWKSAREGKPVPRVEQVLQAYLTMSLQGAFPFCSIDVEIDTVAGRLDIEVIESDPFDRSLFERQAILELKALKARDAGGNSVSDQQTSDWVREGILQAFAYRETKKAKAGALCCFDLRDAPTGDLCFRPHIKEAARLDVALRVWYLYRSAVQFRHELASKS